MQENDSIGENGRKAAQALLALFCNPGGQPAFERKWEDSPIGNMLRSHGELDESSQRIPQALAEAWLYTLQRMLESFISSAKSSNRHYDEWRDIAYYAKDVLSYIYSSFNAHADAQGMIANLDRLIELLEVGRDARYDAVPGYFLTFQIQEYFSENFPWASESGEVFASRVAMIKHDYQEFSKRHDAAGTDVLATLLSRLKQQADDFADKVRDGGPQKKDDAAYRQALQSLHKEIKSIEAAWAKKEQEHQRAQQSLKDIVLWAEEIMELLDEAIT